MIFKALENHHAPPRAVRMSLPRLPFRWSDSRQTAPAYRLFSRAPQTETGEAQMSPQLDHHVDGRHHLRTGEMFVHLRLAGPIAPQSPREFILLAGCQRIPQTARRFTQ